MALGLAACPGRPAAVDDAGTPGLVDAGEPDAGFVDAGEPDAGFVDVVEDPQAPATFTRLLRIGGSGEDWVEGATVLDDGTVVVAARVTNTGDVSVGEGQDALAVDSSAGGVVAGFDDDGAPRWAVPVQAEATSQSRGLVVGMTPWPGASTPAGSYLALVRSDGTLAWSTPTNGIFFDGTVGGGAATAFFAECVEVDGITDPGCGGFNSFTVARLDAASGEVKWVRSGRISGAETRVFRGSVDQLGRAYLVHATNGAVFYDGAEVAVDADPVARAEVIALDAAGDVRWIYVDSEPAGVGASEIVSLADAGDGTLLAAGTIDGIFTPSTFVPGDGDFDNRKLGWAVRLDEETGAPLADERFVGADELAEVVSTGGRVWMLDVHATRTAPVLGDVVFKPRGGIDFVIAAFDESLKPLAAMALGGSGFGPIDLAAHGDTVVGWSSGGGAIWLDHDGALERVEAGGPIDVTGTGDALALLYRAKPTLPVPPPSPVPFASSAHLRRVGGSGFDAANGVQFLSDGSLVVTGRFTATDDAVAGDIALAGELDWPMGFVARFDVDGNALWAVTAGAPMGIGLGFPLQSLAVGADDAVYVAGNVGDGGGRFAFGAVDEADFDGAFVAKLDPSTGAIMWVSPLDATLVAVPALAVDETGATAIAAEVTSSSTPATAPTQLDQRVLHLDAESGVVTVGGARPGGIRGVVPALHADFSVRAAVVVDGVTWACGTTSADVDDVDRPAESVLARFDASGALRDERLFGTPEGCTGVAVDGDRLVVLDTAGGGSARAYGDLDYEPHGFVDAVAATFDLDGNALTARAIGGRGYERGLAVAAHAGLVAVAGDFRDGFNLDDGTRVVPVRGDALVVLLEDP